MIERFQKIMEYAGVSPKRFAEILGIERSNVSHIMSGRNNPSLTVVQKILKNFPDISSDWLLFGEGNMLKANATGVNTSVNTNTDAVSVAAPTVNANAAPVTTTNTASANTNVGTSQVHIEPVVEQPRPKVDKPEPPRQPIAPPSSPTPDAPPHKNIEYQTITTPIVNDTNVQPTSTQIQSMLANGLIVLEGIGVDADPATAYRVFENCARSSGDSRAYCQLGIACLQGNGCPEDEALGKAYLDTAAGMGNVLAMYDLGLCYLNGYGCVTDTAIAISWLEKAADNGRIDAINSLGDVYEAQGEFKNAVLYFEKAVTMGSLEGYCNLGYCYEQGQGVVLNSKKAYELYLYAAEHGSVRGCMCVANCYINGIYVEKDMAKALEWYTKAAEGGNVLAMYYCGIILENGDEGVPANKKQSKKWLKMAADAGYAPAAAALGRMK